MNRWIVSSPENLEELLAAARAAGQFESTGRFTLDPGRAAEMLARYQLADPRAFILKLVQWAVASQARSISLEVGPTETVVHHDGQALREEDVADLSSHLLRGESGGSPRCLRHLAAALNTLVRLRPAGLVLESRSRDSFRFRVHGQTSVVERAHTDEMTSTRTGWTSRIAIGLRQTDWKSALKLQTPTFGRPVVARLRHAEESLVWNGCPFASVPVLLNQRPVNRPYFGVPACHFFRHPLRETLDLRRIGPPVSLLGHLLEGFVKPRIHVPFWSPRLRFEGTLFVAAEKCAPGLLAAPSADALGTPTWVQLARLDSEEPARSGFDPFGREIRVPGIQVEGKPTVASHAMVARQGGSSEVLFVQDGVMVSREPAPADLPPGYLALVAAGELTADLSHFGIVHDDRYRRVMRRLGELIRQHLGP